MVNITNMIRVKPKIKKALDRKKLVDTETYSSVIERLINDLELIKGGVSK